MLINEQPKHPPSVTPLTSRANRNWSILNEYLRTRPGALRSDHPEHPITAIGCRARWIAENHPLTRSLVVTTAIWAPI
jgi:aminoglycoside 3-N-acetyltransferase